VSRSLSATAELLVPQPHRQHTSSMLHYTPPTQNNLFSELQNLHILGHFPDIFQQCAQMSTSKQHTNKDVEKLRQSNTRNWIVVCSKWQLIKLGHSNLASKILHICPQKNSPSHLQHITRRLYSTTQKIMPSLD